MTDTLEKNLYGQAKCPHCYSWHFAIQLDDFFKATGEVKCCKCGRFYDISKGIIISTPNKLKEIEDGNKGRA
jgi:predicted Zn finger-like uncharacterized protein